MRAFLCGFALFALLATLSAVFSSSSSSSSSSSFDLVSKSATTTTDMGGGGRRLLSAGGGECKPTKDWEKVGGLIGYFVGVLYLFLGDSDSLRRLFCRVVGGDIGSVGLVRRRRRGDIHGSGGRLHRNLRVR